MVRSAGQKHLAVEPSIDATAVHEPTDGRPPKRHRKRTSLRQQTNRTKPPGIIRLRHDGELGNTAIQRRRQIPERIVIARFCTDVTGPFRGISKEKHQPIVVDDREAEIGTIDRHIAERTGGLGSDQHSK